MSVVQETKTQDERATGGNEAKLAEELGALVDWVAHELRVPREPGERVSEYIKRAFKSKATRVTEQGEMHVLVLSELGAAALLGNRQKKEGASSFGRVMSEYTDADNNYSFKRDGKVDQFRVMHDHREFRRLTHSKTGLQSRLGELAGKRQAIKDKVAGLEQTLALNKVTFDSRFSHERDTSEEALVIEQKEEDIRLLNGQIPGLDVEIDRIKRRLKECENATRGKYMTLHEIPAKVNLEVEVRWPV